MTALRDAIDYTTLGWVKPELDETLRQARIEIESFADEPSDTSRMRFCAGYLHQVQGTLRMVELYAPAMVVEEMEQLAAALQRQDISDRDGACATLMRGVVLLPDYLERLQGGHKDIPIVLLPLLNELRAARGQDGLSESVLFAPDLARPLPPSLADAPAAVPAADAAAQARAMRPLLDRFADALSTWPDAGAPAELAALKAAIDALLAHTAQDDIRRMLWVAERVAAALADAALPASPSLRQAFASVQREARRHLADDGFATPNPDSTLEPTRQLLFHVAQLDGSAPAAAHPALRELRTTFDLDAQRPTESELSHARGSLSGRNRALLETVAAAVKEDLLRVKDALDLHLRAPDASVADLQPQIDTLGRVGDTLGMLGLDAARNVVLSQRVAMQGIVGGDRAPDESVLLDVAGALLYVDASLDDQVARLGGSDDRAGQDDLFASESRKLTEAIAREAIANFADARQAFVAFVETSWNHAELDEVPRLLREVAGALAMLELPVSAGYLDAVRTYTEVELIGRRRVPNGRQLDTFADALASLEYYLEALRDNRGSRDDILDIARGSLETLGYWPLPAPVAVPAAGDAATAPEAGPVDGEIARTVASMIDRGISDMAREAGPPPLPRGQAASDAGVHAAALAPPDPSAGLQGPPRPASEPPPLPPLHVPVPAQLATATPTAPADAPAGSSLLTATSAAAGGFDNVGDEIDDEIREVFIEEFGEEIDNLDTLLPPWRAAPETLELLRPIRRVFHTLKGSGRLVGARVLGEFSWKVENMLNRVLDGTRAPSPAVVAMVDNAFYALPQLHAALRGQGAVTVDLDALQRVADRVADGEDVFAPAAALSLATLESTDAAVAANAANAADALAEANAGADAGADGALADAPEPDTDTAAGSVDALPASVDALLLEILQSEVTGHLKTMDGWLDSARTAPATASDALLRATHTMSGAFAMTEVPAITDALAPAEGYIRRLLASGQGATPAGVAAIGHLADAVRATMFALHTAAPMVPTCAALAAALVALRDSLPEDSPRAAMPDAPEPDAADADDAIAYDDGQRTAADAASAATPAAPVELTGIDLSRYGSLAAGLSSTIQDRAEAADRAAGAAIDAERRAADEAARADIERRTAQAAEEAAKVEAARIAAEEAEKAEAERLAAEEAAKLEAERLAAEEAAKLEAERVAAEEAAKLEAERIAAEEAENAEAERIAAEEAAKVEAERIAAEEAAKLEAERLAAEEAAKLEAERLAAEEAAKLEAERLAAEEAAKLEAERVAAEEAAKLEAERIAAEEAAKLEAERIAAEEAAKADAARTVAEEELEYARLEAYYAEQDRRARERAAEVAASRVDAEVLARERLAAEQREAEAAAVERIAAERAAIERIVAAQTAELQTAGADGIAVVPPAALVDAVDAAADVNARSAIEDAGSTSGAADAPASAMDVHPDRAADEAIDGNAANASHDDDTASAAVAPTPAETMAATASPAAAEGPGSDPDVPLDLTGLDPELIDIFVEEAGDLLDHSDGLVAQLREAPGEREPLVGLQRDLHTIKGGARMAGIMAVGELGHAMETLLEAVVDQRVELGVDGVPLLERGFDRLHAMLTRVAARQGIDPSSRLIAAFNDLAHGRRAAEAGAAVPGTSMPAPKLALAPLSSPLTSAFGADDDDIGVRAPQEQVRIRADLLDRLVTYAGEVAIYRSRLEQQLGAFRGAMGEMEQTNARLRDQLRRLDIETEAQIIARFQRETDTSDATFDPLELDRFSTLQQLSRALGESAADLASLQGTLDDLTRQYETLLLQQSRVSSDLQEGLMRTRMVPFDALVPRLRRVVRQAASDTGKQVQLKLDGAQGELDRSVLERMTAPLEHMLRNAVAHGVEAADDRRGAGKPEEGTVRITVRREGSEVVLEVSDDGSGLDRAAIRRRGEERGLVRSDATLSDGDLDALILQPGFSTASEVSRLAGRGVGMDVVASEVRQLGGTLDIASQRGAGTTFTLRLPQTLAVTQAAFVKIGDTSFAVPIASVRGVGRLAREQFTAHGAVYAYGGEDYVVHDLGKLVGHVQAKADGQLQLPVLLIRSGDLRVAVVVDQILGNREIVVKPVGPQVASIPGIFGATVMGDGRVVVILDIAPLVRRQAALPADTAPVAVAERRHVPLVMVVDDSVTMRKVTGRVLERNNFEVASARDGVDALERMAERVPDLMLLDIEMPRMDGYELATAMKADPRLREVPIVMITSRTGEKHRQRAFEIGVERYLGKPYQETELLRHVFDLLKLQRRHDG